MASDSGSVSVLVLLDFSAASETTDHRILIGRLEQVVGIRGMAITWFKSYLLGRFQLVQVNNDSSSRTRVSCGVPQASVLGLMLFSFYMLPFGNIIRKHELSLLCGYSTVFVLVTT